MEDETYTIERKKKINAAYLLINFFSILVSKNFGNTT